MTTPEKLTRLLKLADLAKEFEFLDLKLVNLFCDLREEFGLAKLLLLIEEYAIQKFLCQAPTQTPETPNTDQDTTAL